MLLLSVVSCLQVLGEKLVLAANGQQGLATCALRPSSVFGEYDTLFLPTVVAKAREGKMKYFFGTAVHDWTYAGNIAHACLLVRPCIWLASPQVVFSRTADLLHRLFLGQS